MDEYQLLVDFHKESMRQGPGGEVETKMAIRLAGLNASRSPRIVDIGCGTGAATFALARELGARVTAVDFSPEFLGELESRAAQYGLVHQIDTIACSMDALPFSDECFDVIWSEGAIYNMGFAKGLAYWKKFLKPGGMLVVSEITWFTTSRPVDLQMYWEAVYPEIDVASAKIDVLERHGYIPEAYFTLPKHCWSKHYYNPMNERFETFLARHGQSRSAVTLVDREKQEIAFYEKYHPYYGYGVYIARNPEN